jgi:hypothetical protein
MAVANQTILARRASSKSRGLSGTAFQTVRSSTADLRDESWRVSENTVAATMRELGLPHDVVGGASRHPAGRSAVRARRIRSASASATSLGGRWVSGPAGCRSLKLASTPLVRADERDQRPVLALGRRARNTPRPQPAAVNT